MIIVKSDSDLERMRASGRIAARVRDQVAEAISPGVRTAELADLAAELIRGHGAESAFLGYRGYPGHICVSVNDTVVHGIPGDRRVSLGDIVSIDVGVRYEGFIGDTAMTVMVGVTDERVIHLVETARKALAEGIAMADVSHAIEQTAILSGFVVVREFVGHGIGRQMHEDPQIPNFGSPGRGPRLRRGMTMALEPMLNMVLPGVSVDSDGWTVLTRDGKPSAHFEHTIAVCDGEAEILTA
jgi:methionyl aminopeptidase